MGPAPVLDASETFFRGLLSVAVCAAADLAPGHRLVLAETLVDAVRVVRSDVPAINKPFLGALRNRYNFLILEVFGTVKGVPDIEKQIIVECFWQHHTFCTLI